MFITEEEARRRIKDSDNLLNRLGIKVPVQKVEPKDEPLEAASDELSEQPTNSSEGDPVRLAVLAGRRATRPAGHRGGRYPGQGPIPSELRSLIGAAAKMTSPAQAAKAFGVNPVLPYHYSKGRTGLSAEPKPSLLASIEQDTMEIRQQVLGVMAFTVAGITKESIENKDPKELSIIARNLSSIMSATKPPADFGDKTTNAQVIVFSPEQGTEPDYDRVEIG